ncbi:hypothetical protein GCM10027517_02950 [Phycicoccus ginsengisoli]
MPRPPVSPHPLPALETALDAASGGARAGADEVLSHYPELGDRDTQSSLEEFLDQAADLLREVEASCADLSDRVRLSGASARPRPRPDRPWPDRLGDERLEERPATGPSATKGRRG